MGLEMFRKILDNAQTGDNIGVLLKNVHHKDVYRGCILSVPGVMKTYKAFFAKVYILTEKEGGRSKPFKSGYKPQFFFRVSNVTGTVCLDKEEDLVLPGDTLNVKIVLIEKAVLNNGLRFVMREGKLTIGAGVITNVMEINF
jgi:elongation factor Tu